jgi:uncharacterized protein involved in oxidation of intracellular sulfur
MKISKTIMAVAISFLTLTAHAQGNAHTDDKTVIKIDILKTDLAIVISSSDPETVWNAFRLANYSASQKSDTKVFLLGKGVEAQDIKDETFDVKKMMENFVASGGQIMACGTCLKLRNTEGSALCPVSTLADLYMLIQQSDKVLNF